MKAQYSAASTDRSPTSSSSSETEDEDEDVELELDERREEVASERARSLP